MGGKERRKDLVQILLGNYGGWSISGALDRRREDVQCGGGIAIHVYPILGECKSKILVFENNKNINFRQQFLLARSIRQGVDGGKSRVSSAKEWKK